VAARLFFCCCCCCCCRWAEVGSSLFYADAMAAPATLWHVLETDFACLGEQEPPLSEPELLLTATVRSHTVKVRKEGSCRAARHQIRTYSAQRTKHCRAMNIRESREHKTSPQIYQTGLSSLANAARV
jgi:hypothetical protein